MAIEFNCSECSAVLSVDDEYAGKSAQCPSCQTVLTVPLAGATNPPYSNRPANDPAAAGQQPGFDQGAANPYSPSAQLGSAAQVPGQPTRVPIGSIFSHASTVWGEKLGILLGATAIQFAVSFSFSAAAGILETIGRDNNVGMLILVSSLVRIFGSLVTLFLGIGMARICLATARRQSADIGMLFSGGDKFLPILGTTILMSIASAIALLLLIIPFILLWVFLWPFYYFIVDRQCAAMDSFSRAFEIAKLNGGTSFVLMIASFAIAIAGIIALGIGLLFAAPFISVLWATAYLMMKGELALHGGNSFAPA